jgi:signal transduction histidine kinase
MLKRFFKSFNIVGQCRQYRVSLWMCPPFLFILMGFVIIAGMSGTYIVTSKFSDDPSVVVISVSAMTAFLFMVGHAVVTSFQRLADASRLKSEFISIVSHQLRSPLSAIKWQLEIMLEQAQAMAGEIPAAIRTIRDQNERMIALVNDLLEVNRIEDDRLMLRPVHISLGDFVEEIVGEYQPMAQKSRVNLTVHKQDSGLWVFIDDSKLRWVCENLLDNAIRYTKEGGNVQVSIFKSGAMGRVEVEDDGVGIPLAAQTKIFTQFFRAENAMRTHAEGTGLGLYLVKELVKAMGGKVGFVSLENKGSTFWFTVPLINKKP